MVDFLKWIATLITLGGALATALALDPLHIWLLNLGSVLFLMWGILIKEKAMVAVNAGLLGIYAFGLMLRM